jgi:hypothetical protein
MFERPHHRRIEKLLHAFDSGLLETAQCYFARGTAITLSLGEYRESLDAANLERFPAKWTRFALRKRVKTKNREPRSDSIGTEKALALVQQTGFVIECSEIIGETEHGKETKFLWMIARQPCGASCSS